MKKALLTAICLFASSYSFANALATTTAFGRSLNVDETKEVSSLHDIYIYNESPYVKVYTLEYLLCPQMYGCKTLIENIFVEAHNSFRKQTKMILPVIYHMKGNFQLIAQTFIRTNTLLESETTGKALIQIHS